MIDEKKGISRGEFLSVVGGLGLAVVLAKFSSIKGVADAIKPKGTTVATVPNSYGNNTYGGKKTA